jgi:hypothetical protein
MKMSVCSALLPRGIDSESERMNVVVEKKCGLTSWLHPDLPEQSIATQQLQAHVGCAVINSLHQAKAAE